MVNGKNSLKFNKEFFHDLWLLLIPYWTSDEKWMALRLLSLNVFCSVVGVRATVALNEFNKDFFNALQDFNKAALTTALLHFLMIATVMIIAVGYSSYFNGLLSIRWRRWLTKHYLSNWLENHNHYRMQLQNINIDNPDQRISEDLDKFPTMTLSIIFLIFESILSLASFGYILWNLSGSLIIPLGNVHIEIPGYLLWGAIIYGTMGTLITGWIGKKLSGFDYDQQLRNADFRFSLARLRESSEQIAMYKGEDAESAKFNNLFSHIYDNYLKIISLNKRLAYFKSGYGVFSFLAGIFMSIPLYFQKKIQLGGMMEISGAFRAVVGAFSSLIYSFSLFAEWRAVVYRLSEFNRSINVSSQADSRIVFREHDQNNVNIKNLTILLPDGSSLFNGLNLSFHGNDAYLLTGQSGLGKSTLLRTVSKLWLHGDGEIIMPKNKTLFFLPQKPYLPLGSLKEVLLYPDTQNINDDTIIYALECCELIKLKNRIDEVNNWSLELSLGEQQLIGFARIFLKKPDFVFLDEATSALDERTESIVYGKLREILPHATIISVGHRASLQQFHQHIITLTKNSYRALEDVSDLQLVTGT